MVSMGLALPPSWGGGGDVSHSPARGCVPARMAHLGGPFSKSGLLHLLCRHGASTVEIKRSRRVLGQHLGTGFLLNTCKYVPGAVKLDGIGVGGGNGKAG